jgi:hypothetical protein
MIRHTFNSPPGTHITQLGPLGSCVSVNTFPLVIPPTEIVTSVKDVVLAQGIASTVKIAKEEAAQRALEHPTMKLLAKTAKAHSTS